MNFSCCVWGTLYIALKRETCPYRTPWKEMSSFSLHDIARKELLLLIWWCVYGPETQFGAPFTRMEGSAGDVVCRHPLACVVDSLHGMCRKEIPGICLLSVTHPLTSLNWTLLWKWQQWACLPRKLLANSPLFTENIHTYTCISISKIFSGGEFFVM